MDMGAKRNGKKIDELYFTNTGVGKVRNVNFEQDKRMCDGWCKLMFSQWFMEDYELEDNISLTAVNGELCELTF